MRRMRVQSGRLGDAIIPDQKRWHEENEWKVERRRMVVARAFIHERDNLRNVEFSLRTALFSTVAIFASGVGAQPICRCVREHSRINR
jgi:hypothetical protein